MRGRWSKQVGARAFSGTVGFGVFLVSIVLAISACNGSDSRPGTRGEAEPSRSAPVETVKVPAPAESNENPASPAATESGANKIVCEGSTTVGPIAKAFAEYYRELHPNVNVTVSESGSGNGAKALINGTCDVAPMSRFMKVGEWQAAAESGIMPVAHVVALDGLPVLVHPGNPIDGLTMEQLKAIYIGRITNWSQVGGPDVGIVKISRDSSSGTFETFEGLVMQGEKIAEDTEYVGSNGAVRSRVATTPAAIGYAGLGFVDSTVKALEINGVYPEKATVITGEYPIARPLFMFTSGYPELGTHLYRFITLHLSEKGQEIVEEIGFVPVTNY